MMKPKIPKLLFTSLLSTFLLVGFSGKEKYIELDGYLNGRSSADFSAGARNVINVLDKGTRGEITEAKKLPSGNYGFRLKVMSGPNQGKYFWVYHNVKNSDLKMFEQIPSNWANAATLETKDAEQAKAVETIRSTPARAEKEVVPQPTRAKATEQETDDVMTLIAASNRKVQKVGEPVCTTCLENTHTATGSILKPAKTRQMAEACSSFMNSNGELGPDGQSVMSIMASPKYAQYFTADNSLGGFCPRFNTLSDSQKLMAWTWFWTALAMEEASCNPTLPHATTYKNKQGQTKILNPREGYGLWALERDRNVRAWRGEACNNISTVEGQARCTIDIMVDRQLSKGRTAKMSSGSYWGPIHRGDTQLMPHMRRMSQCF